jgi:translocator protein
MATYPDLDFAHSRVAAHEGRRALITFVAASLAIAALASAWSPAISSASATFLATLRKPAWFPAAAVFAPAWIVLYALMAIAAWRVWLTYPSCFRTRALRLYWAQLGLTAAWMPILFGTRFLGLATATSLALLLAVLVTQRAFRPIDAKAARLLWPCIGWAIMAFLLNFTIWQMNG